MRVQTNRCAYSITIHNASWDYEGSQPRHGTRVTSLAEKPIFDANAPTRREGLGLLGPEEIQELADLSRSDLEIHDYHDK